MKKLNPWAGVGLPSSDPYTLFYEPCPELAEFTELAPTPLLLINKGLAAKVLNFSRFESEA